MTSYFKTIIRASAATVIFALSAFAQGTDLGAKHWQLIYLNGKAVGDTKAYIEIDPSTGKFNGNAGCNRMFGSIKVDGRSVAISGVGMTRMACVESNVMKLEADFTKALQTATRYRVNDDELSIYADDKRIIRLRASADLAGSAASTTTKLEDRKWVLESIGKTPAGEIGKQVFINFNAAKGSAGGNSSCNAFGGDYLVKGNSLAFKGIISTMRACIEDNRMSTERSFLDGLQATDRYEIKDGMLNLYKGDTLLLALRGEKK